MADADISPVLRTGVAGCLVSLDSVQQSPTRVDVHPEVQGRRRFDAGARDGTSRVTATISAVAPSLTAIVSNRLHGGAG